MTRDDAPSGTDRAADVRFRQLFDGLQDAIVDFEFDDGEPVIRAVNDGFRELFGVDETIVGTPLNELIVPSDRAPRSDRFDERTAAGKPNRAIVSRRTESGVQTLLYRGIPYQGGARGFAVYTDLTDEIRQERELAVLNRVLRDNLSSEVDTLIDHAERLLVEIDEPNLTDEARAIRTSASALERLSQEARDIERALDAAPDLDPVAVPAAVEAALDDLRVVDHADVTVDVDGVPPVMASVHLDQAIAALVDNAVRHAGGSSPSVRITATRSGESITVTVSDSGPGLPERERRLLTGEVEPTPLDHGDGLGLWLVRWIVTASGGSVTYRERDDGGSEIALELAAA
jgi:signal transduction histidine kinase